MIVMSKFKTVRLSTEQPRNLLLNGDLALSVRPDLRRREKRHWHAARYRLESLWPRGGHARHARPQPEAALPIGGRAPREDAPRRVVVGENGVASARTDLPERA